jgi:cob(I)alamin adenosyltransferase
MEQALIQVYTGSGKGKTSAAVGLIIRALGQGFKVLLVRFLKPYAPPGNELQILEKLQGLDVVTAGLGGIEARDRPEELAENVTATFDQILPMIYGGFYDLVVLDEFNPVLAKGYLPLARGLQLLDQRPAGVELVLTGRNAPPEVLQRADLVTVMEARRHPFAAGLPARAGIDY